MKNLNEQTISSDGQPNIFQRGAGSVQSLPCKTVVHFTDIEQHLCKYIHETPIVVGCVAWLTNYNILESLKTCGYVQLIVQKEDFLRPDTGSGNAWKTELRRRYDALHDFVWRFSLPHPICSLSTNSDQKLESVRCVGNYQYGKKESYGLMHHKFFVFCNFRQDDTLGKKIIKPYAVWTGSWNPTRRSTFSLENGIFIEGRKVAEMYLNEWLFMVSISEPLDWNSEWSEPEWRIGT